MERDGPLDKPHTQRPTAGVAAARPQAYPAVGGGACPLAGIGAAPTGGARRRRDAAGRVGRGRTIGRLPPLHAGRGTLRARTGRIDARDGYGAANSPPEAATRETEGRVGGQRNDWTRTGRIDAHDGHGAGPKGGRLPRLR